jgi:phosphoribosyl 1,2-cyclic phosphodiesterase
MSLTVCSLASGSAANAILVASESTAVLIDAGLSARQTAQRLEQIGWSLDRVQGICLSHEHGDHIAGLPVLHSRHGIPVYANAATADLLARDKKFGGLHWRIFTTGSPFRVGDLTLEPFNVPHDALDPCGFVIRAGEARVAVATDLGAVTTLVRLRLRDCHAVVVEANHDEWQLQQSDRPWSLKQRILGRQGHLSNTAAAELIAETAGPALQHVFLAHLSGDCNHPDSARACVRRALDAAGHRHVAVETCRQDAVSSVWRYQARPLSAAAP